MAKAFAHAEAYLPSGGKYYSLEKLGDGRVWKLPYSIRVLLESAIRNADGHIVTAEDVGRILGYYSEGNAGSVEVPFCPARVLLQDFTGVPCVVDLAAMRDAVSALGGDPQRVNPLVPVDLVVDHSVQVDVYRDPQAVEKNKALEMQRNKERFQFIKWGSGAFSNFRVVPPGAGIVHQVNLEYLARVVVDTAKEANADSGAEPLLYPDSCVGTDSHTTMVDGLGVAGWGVGGIEAEAAMLGQPITMVLPLVVGFHLTGELGVGVTATDLVLTIVEMLRKKKVVGKFVEFYGPGVANLTLADRATVANMAPEYGATMGFFPLDDITLEYLKQTGRSDEHVERCRAYAKANGFFAVPETDAKAPHYDDTISLDLSTVVPCLSGPKRPHDRVALHQMPTDWAQCLSNPVGFKGFNIAPERQDDIAEITLDGQSHKLKHGSIVIAAITSCTNTSNPEVMVAAGLVAQKASELGLRVPSYVKTSLAPGSNVVTSYLEEAKLMKPLENLGFHVVGYGCTTCIGNSGDIPVEVSDAIQNKDLVAASVLSGNRNFEGRVHQFTRANYLASPPLVVAYALAGRVDIDFEKEPIGTSKDGKPVFLRDIWPENGLIRQTVAAVNTPTKYRETYERIFSKNKGKGIVQRIVSPVRHILRLLRLPGGEKTKTASGDAWGSLEVPGEGKELFPWDPESTYINKPPYFKGMTRDVPTELAASAQVNKARCLLFLGDSVTTDHISPAGNIAVKSPAAEYMMGRGVQRKDFNSYGARRGHDEVMARGTFANVRMVNNLLKNPAVQAKLGGALAAPKGAPEAPKTVHIPSMEPGYVYDVAMRYKAENVPAIVVAGAEYGTGSSRDWAAKGPYLQGVKAVIATTFERIHRSNLIGMGVLPLQFKDGETAETVGLTGLESFTLKLPSKYADIKPGMPLEVEATTDEGVSKTFTVKLRVDTKPEIGYMANGGILQTVVRQLA